MSTSSSAGARLRAALSEEKPLQMVGTVNAYTAIMAERVGFRAFYLSGAGVANASYGLPDLGMTTLGDVLEDVRRITGVTDVPLLVDADTGWGGAFMIARSVKEMARSGAAGIHVEDQVAAKRCGHRPGKQLVSTTQMVDRIKAAVDARRDPEFVIMARTDAFASEGLAGVVERACRYREAGADMLFPEALPDGASYREVVHDTGMPVLANITEFGATPLLGREELAGAGVSIILYPLSAFRAMSAAALNVYRTIRGEGTQASAVPTMQTRRELYDFLGYLDYERKLDRLLAGKDES
ncbi:MAG TPA: methylisocitrate lyase [Geobacteraceae bacterium]